jgi:hypothetical protein
MNTAKIIIGTSPFKEFSIPVPVSDLSDCQFNVTIYNLNGSIYRSIFLESDTLTVIYDYPLPTIINEYNFKVDVTYNNKTETWVTGRMISSNLKSITGNAVTSTNLFTTTQPPSGVDIPALNIIQDSTHRFVTDEEKNIWNSGGSGILYWDGGDASSTNLITIFDFGRVI